MLDVHIVSTIISHSDRRTVVNCARVCHLWAEIALDDIWKIMDNLKPLLEILCPLSETKDGQGREAMKFSRELETSDWVRFEYYAQRVRTLSISPIHKIDKSVFIELGCFRQSQNILPNLTCLYLFLHRCTYVSLSPDVSLTLPRYSIMFLHKNITRLVLVLPTTHGGLTGRSLCSAMLAAKELIPLPRFFRDISTRSPDVTQAVIEWVYKDDVLESDLISLVAGWRRLRSIHLPRCTITPSLLKVLSTIKGIREIQSTEVSRGLGMFRKCSNDEYTLQDNVRLEALVSLRISANPIKLVPAFNCSEVTPFPRLSFLHISLLSSYKARDIGELNNALSEGCPNLEVLKLKHDEDTGSSHLDESITLAEIQPLTQLKRLHTFEIESNARFTLTDDELANFIRRCCSIKNLRLAQEPYDLYRPRLTLNILSKLGAIGSGIKTLGIYVDATVECRISDHIIHRLPSLTRLDFGDSPIVDNATTALILCQYLPFTLVLGTRCRTDLPQQDRRDKQRSNWVDVEKLLEFAGRVRDADTRRVHMKKLMELSEMASGWD